MVRTFTLSDGKKIPAIAWGSGTGGLSSAGEKAVETGVWAIEAGIRHLDCAQSYGTEAENGAAIQRSGVPHSEIFMTTKISDTSNTQTTAADVKRSVQESLDKLGFIPDLLLIHTPFVPEQGKIGEFWGYLEDLVADGTLKGCSLGVSNFRPQDIEAVMKVAKIKPVCNQLEFHPYLLTHLKPVLDLHEQYGIVTETYGGLSPLLRHKTGGPLKPVLTKIAQKLSSEAGEPVDEVQALVQYFVTRGVVVVTTSTKKENLAKLVATEKLRDLTPDEVQEIEEVGKKIHFRGYREHDGRLPRARLAERRRQLV